MPKILSFLFHPPIGGGEAKEKEGENFIM